MATSTSSARSSKSSGLASLQSFSRLRVLCKSLSSERRLLYKSLQTSLLQPSLSVPTLLLRRTGCSLTTSSCSESMPQSARCPQGTAVPLRDGEGGGKRCTKTAGCGSQVLDSDDDEDAAPPLPPPPEVHVEMKEGMQGRRVNGKARNCLPLQGQKKEEGRSAEASRRGGRIRFQR